MTSSMVDMLDADDASLTDPLDFVRNASTSIFNVDSVSLSMRLLEAEEEDISFGLNCVPWSFGVIKETQMNDLINSTEQLIHDVTRSEALGGVAFTLSSPETVINISDLIEDPSPNQKLVIIDLTHD